jgi:hypothetical protein
MLEERLQILLFVKFNHHEASVAERPGITKGRGAVRAATYWSNPGSTHCVIWSFDKFTGHGTLDIPTFDSAGKALSPMSRVGMSNVPCLVNLSKGQMT